MTQQILIIGGDGQIAWHARRALIAETTAQLTLFVRHPEKVRDLDPKRERIVVGDARRLSDVEAALAGIDTVYVNLGGMAIEQMVGNVVTAMTNAHVQRLIWISTLGIYDEVPGEFGRFNNETLGATDPMGDIPRHARAAAIVESSPLDYTIIRPAWLVNRDVVDYELTARNEPFRGTIVSRKSVGALISRIVQAPAAFARQSLGVNQPHTDGDRPRLML